MKRGRMVFLLASLLLSLSSITLFAQGVGRGAAKSLGDIFFQPKYLTMLILGLAGLVLLKKRWLNGGMKAALLLTAVFFFGIAGNIAVPFFAGFALHPSPICSVAKAMLYGFAKPMIVTVAVIFLLSLIGPRLFCGWVCPVGALQELMAMLADKLKIRRRRVPYRASNTVRVFILMLFVFLSATAVIHLTTPGGEKIPLALYDWINAFHGFEFVWIASTLDLLIHYLPFLLTVLLALFIYRPYCHFVCPIGLITHWLEPVALFRVNRKNGACNDCGACIPQTPCQAVPEILKATPLRPDCFACGECLKCCAQDAFVVEAGSGTETKPE
jgi:polyferredoxin